ncbi:MAG: hypothetical protein JO057_07600, partial [Chloroflexi bacterium]|nr:hypothetical protein [Chloroflexota bacterium]
VQVAYDDGRITILASGSARPKAEFWGKAQIASDNASIIDSLQAAPGDILGVPKLEAPDVSDALATQLTHANENHTSVDMEDYRPNSVRLRVQAPSAGVVVLKDSFFPGWQATLNGVSANVVRVNGIVRGVIVPQPGDYEVEFVYRPTTFVAGVWLSIAVLLLLIASLVWDLRQRRGEHLRSIPAMPVGADVPA